MATIHQCDRCKAVSPDEQGLHTANNWFVVKVAPKYSTRGTRRRLPRTSEILLCGHCLTQAWPALLTEE